MIAAGAFALTVAAGLAAPALADDPDLPGACEHTTDFQTTNVGWVGRFYGDGQATEIPVHVDPWYVHRVCVKPVGGPLEYYDVDPAVHELTVRASNDAVIEHYSLFKSTQPSTTTTTVAETTTTTTPEGTTTTLPESTTTTLPESTTTTLPESTTSTTPGSSTTQPTTSTTTPTPTPNRASHPDTGVEIIGLTVLGVALIAGGCWLKRREIADWIATQRARFS